MKTLKHQPINASSIFKYVIFLLFIVSKNVSFGQQPQQNPLTLETIYQRVIKAHGGENAIREKYSYTASMTNVTKEREYTLESWVKVGSYYRIIIEDKHGLIVKLCGKKGGMSYKVKKKDTTFYFISPKRQDAYDRMIDNGFGSFEQVFLTYKEKGDSAQLLPDKEFGMFKIVIDVPDSKLCYYIDDGNFRIKAVSKLGYPGSTSKRLDGALFMADEYQREPNGFLHMSKITLRQCYLTDRIHYTGRIDVIRYVLNPAFPDDIFKFPHTNQVIRDIDIDEPF